jgi:hypothetical protein
MAGHQTDLFRPAGAVAISFAHVKAMLEVDRSFKVVCRNSFHVAVPVINVANGMTLV